MEKAYEKYPVSIFNTLIREKEEFKPIQPPHVGMYVCGPTVYGDPHLGHARSSITFDLVFRYLKFLGYSVRYVRNITDVGHLEDEVAGEGEDKITKKARLEKLEPMEVAQAYTNSYHKAMDALNVQRPSIEPTATGHIPEQIDTIQKILDNGYAYEKNGSVYFDLKKYNEAKKYGELSGKVLEDLKVGTRDTEGLDEKDSPFDFALWKKADEKHIMKWDSPWGVGFPGWHLECTAMSCKYLGKSFDIHGGGMDLQFPHHEAEIAQCNAAHGTDPVNYWMHNNMLTIDGAKMSKSAGNFINLEEFFTGNHEKLDKGYSPMTIRFFMLQAHYGSPIDFSNDALKAAEAGLQKLLTAQDALNTLKHNPNGNPDVGLEKQIEGMISGCYKNMSDDFNTAKTLSALFGLSAKIYAFKNGKADVDHLSSEAFENLKSTFNSFVTDVLGLTKETSGDDGLTDGLVGLLISIRNDARASKDFATSDKIRDELAEMGVRLMDSQKGTDYIVEQ